jgi:hypothetical protein
VADAHEKCVQVKLPFGHDERTFLPVGDEYQLAGRR